MEVTDEKLKVVAEDIRRELNRKIDLAVLKMMPREAFWRSMPPGPRFIVRRHTTGVQFLSLIDEAYIYVTMLLNPKDEYWLFDTSHLKTMRKQ